MVFTDAFRAMARKELSDKLKSRWVYVIAVGFTVFTVVIAYFGATSAGVAGFRELNVTIASLTSLVVYFIPILALTLGGGVIADEHDRHTLDIYLSSPISVWEFLLGKFAGLCISLAIPTVTGFGVAGAVVLTMSKSASALSYGIFVAHSLLLGFMFLSISFLISVTFYERSKVIALAVFVWLFYAILYDLALVGLLVVTKGELSPGVFSALLLLNPVDVYRIMNFSAINEYSVLLGMAAVEFPKFMNTPVLWLVCLIWIITPMALSYTLFKRRYMI